MSPIGTSRSSHGFTLLETLIVLGIVSLIAFAVPTVAARIADGARLRDAAFQLSNDLRSLQRQALETATPASVTILDPQLGYVLQPSAQLREIPNGSMISFMADNGQLARPDGTALTFQTSGVSSGGAFTLMLGEHTRVIRIAWPSGHVAVEQ